jgi:hypothetical protein
MIICKQWNHVFVLIYNNAKIYVTIQLINYYYYLYEKKEITTNEYEYRKKKQFLTKPT